MADDNHFSTAAVLDLMHKGFTWTDMTLSAGLADKDLIETSCDDSSKMAVLQPEVPASTVHPEFELV